MMGKTKLTTAQIEALRSQILPAYHVDQLKAQDVPEGEIRDYSRFKLVPVQLLEGSSWNYKDGDPDMEKALDGNLKRNGQIENLNVRLKKNGLYAVGDGHHRTDNFRVNGRSLVLVCDHGAITDKELQRIVLEKQETNFPTNKGRLNNILLGLVQKYDVEDLAVSMPWSSKQLQKILKKQKKQIIPPVKKKKSPIKTVFLKVHKDDFPLLQSKLAELQEEIESLTF